VQKLGGPRFYACFSKTQLLQIQLINKGINEPYWIIYCHLVIQSGEIGLVAIGSGYKIHAIHIAKTVEFLRLLTECVYLVVKEVFSQTDVVGYTLATSNL
jgi:hypothetical protein